MPSFAPKIRIEIYIPIRYEPAYKDMLIWLLEEFTELRRKEESETVIRLIQNGE